MQPRGLTKDLELVQKHPVMVWKARYNRPWEHGLGMPTVRVPRPNVNFHHYPNINPKRNNRAPYPMLCPLCSSAKA